MLKFTKGLICGVFITLCTLILVFTVYATVSEKSISVIYSDVKIMLDGNVIEPKDANGNNVEPFIYEGTTYVPIRAVSNAFGKKVYWNEVTQTVLINTTNEILTMATNSEFPPFEFISDNGIIDKFDGIDIMITKEIGNALGKEIKINDMEFDALIPALISDKADFVIAGITATCERSQCVDFSIPYYDDTPVILIKKGSNITSISDLESKVISNSAYFDDIINELDLKNTTLIDFDNYDEAISALISGEIEAVIIDNTMASIFINKYSELELVKDDENFKYYGGEYAIAVKKGDVQSLNQINEILKQLINNGTINKIVEMYY